MKERKRIISADFNIRTYMYNRAIYIFAFFLPVILLYIAYSVFGVYPFGDMSVLVLDLNGQYVYYFENLRDAFWGNGSLLNSWSRNFTGEIIGIYAYYLASPFTLVVMLLPRWMMTEALLIMQLLKVGAAGVSFCFYLKNSRKASPDSALIFSVLYALMGYMVVQLMNPMWLDGLIYLPFICIGIEKTIDSKKWLNFVIPLALMFTAHFYIGWMIAIFSVLYFIFYYFFLSDVAVPFKIKRFLAAGVRFAVGGLLAAACAAWLLLPLYYSLSLGKLEFSEPSYAMKTQFDFADFFITLMPNVYDTCRPEGSPIVYCGVMTIILIPLFFMNHAIALRRKIGYGLLALCIALSMYMSTVDLVWHGFQVPNWLPYRYSFIFSFVMLIMAAEAFERIEGISFKEIGAMFFMLAAYALYIDKKGLEHVTLLATVWYSIAFAAIYCLLLYMRKKHFKSKPAPVLILIVIFVMAEMTISATYTMTRINYDVTYSKHSSYNRYITLGRNTAQKIYAMDDGIYRIEKNFDRTVNDAMAFGTYGVSHSSSTLNAAPIEFLRSMGFSYGGHYIKYYGATYVTDSLFGIKYVMEQGSKAKPQEQPAGLDYEDILQDEQAPAVDIVTPSKHYENIVLANGDKREVFYVYENPYALPVAFMADNSILDAYVISDNPFVNQNNLLSALISEDYTEFFKQIPVDDIIPENARATIYGNHTRYAPRVEEENSHIEFFITAPTDDMVYLYLPSSYERRINLWYDHELSDTWEISDKHTWLDYYYESGKMVIQPLGRFEPDEKIQVIATITDKKEVFFKEPKEYFYYLDQELFSEAINTLREQPLEITSFKEHRIKGKVTAKKDGILFTTISWEPGWSVKVNGEKVAPVPLLETGAKRNPNDSAPAFVGVPLPEGTHEIEISFFPKGMRIGIIISAIGIITLILIGIYERSKTKILLERLYDF
ncbi:MAG: YfhO family protein [Oscillospiraceae bacterium]|nr:YfhO family protein [Oscillospiraceae bacterium]